MRSAKITAERLLCWLNLRFCWFCLWFLKKKKLGVSIGIKDDGAEASKRVQQSIAAKSSKPKRIRLTAGVPVLFLGVDQGMPKKKIEIVFEV